MIWSHITYVMVNKPSTTSQPVLTRTKYFKSNLIVLSTVDLWSRNEVSPYYVNIEWILDSRPRISDSMLL